MNLGSERTLERIKSDYKFRTERLLLFPLTAVQLRQYLRDRKALERDLGLYLSRAILTHRLRRAIAAKLFKMSQADEKAYIWYTSWLIILTHEPFGAGLLGFKGAPNEHGEVDIGYGIDPIHRRKGYTTEAASGLIRWAFQNDVCQAVLADTDRANTASIRVLEKVGMRIYKTTAESYYWRIDK